MAFPFHAPLGLQLHNLGTSGTHGVTSTTTSLGNVPQRHLHQPALKRVPACTQAPIANHRAGHLHDLTPSSKDAAWRDVRWLERLEGFEFLEV